MAHDADPAPFLDPPLLEVRGLHAAYGGIAALRGVDLHVAAGEVVALIGPNGAGKTTLLNAVSGLLRPRAGSVLLAGRPLPRAAHLVSRVGLLHVPEGRQVLPGMTVQENLELGRLAAGPRTPGTLDRAYALFPILGERRRQLAGSLSGGQQQMLAIARALMGTPRLLMLDEPSLGLAPVVAGQVFAALEGLNRTDGLAVLLVEQNARRALAAAHRAYVLEGGAVVRGGPASDLATDEAVIAHYLGREAA